MGKKIEITEDLKEVVKFLFDQGMSANKVSKQIKIAKAVIRRICEEHNITNKNISLHVRAVEIRSEKNITLIKKLLNEGNSGTNISKQLNISWSTLEKICNENNITNLPKLDSPKSDNENEKFCKDCNDFLPIHKFKKQKSRNDENKFYISPYCLIHEKKRNSDRGKIYSKTYKRDSNKKNKKRNNERERERIASDPSFKLRKLVSKTILTSLKKNFGGKNGESVMKYLPYDILTLKAHIEKQWLIPGNEWMTWENHGAVNKNKRTWQIDHIYPQSLLPYTSMTDENFKLCWNLSNLQPLEAIQNIKKGNKYFG